MTETNTGTNRSAGLSYQQLLDEDSHPVRDILRIESPMPPGPTRVPVERYYSREFHDLEVEKIWKRVWQMACHEDDIPDVGDYHVYEVAHLSFLIVRSAEGEIKAFHNACLHRGRLLRETHGKWARELRCPFHGWSWNLDGSLREIPCKWDFPTVDPCETNLPEAKVGQWGGFVFINPDPNAEPLEDFLGNLSAEFSLLPYEKRYKSAHVAKVLRCNWKVAQEAFSEAYHVIATHPVILDAIGDANTKYDVFGNYSRAFSPNATPSPHLATQAKKWDDVEGQTLYTRRQHPLSGAIYERVEDGVVRVTTPDGRSGLFDDGGVRLEGDLGQVDPHMCNWIGGRQFDGAERIPLVKTEIGEAKNQRAAEAAPIREALRETLGDLMDEVSDAELIDSIYYTVFPNFHPWGSFHRIVYRFRPYGDDPDMCIHECMYFSPAPDPEKRPPPAPMRLLGPDDDWTEAPELGLLAKVFNQDILNLPKVQAGLKATRQPTVIFGDYGESKIRHFHELLEKWIAKP